MATWGSRERLTRRNLMVERERSPGSVEVDKMGGQVVGGGVEDRQDKEGWRKLCQWLDLICDPQRYRCYHMQRS